MFYNGVESNSLCFGGVFGILVIVIYLLFDAWDLEFMGFSNYPRRLFTHII